MGHQQTGAARCFVEMIIGLALPRPRSASHSMTVRLAFFYCTSPICELADAEMNKPVGDFRLLSYKAQ